MKIPANLTLDLEGIDIGESFKISSVKLDTEVTPTIQGRDFVKDSCSTNSYERA